MSIACWDFWMRSWSANSINCVYASAASIANIV